MTNPVRTFNDTRPAKMAAPAARLTRTITLEEAVTQLRVEHAAMPKEQRPGPTALMVLARKRWPHLRDPKAASVTLARGDMPPLMPKTLDAAIETLEQEARVLEQPTTYRDMLLEARRRWPGLRGTQAAPKRATHYGRTVIEELNGEADAFINASPQSFDLAVLEVYRERKEAGGFIGTLKELIAEATERWPQFAGEKLEKDVAAAFERALGFSGVR